MVTNISIYMAFLVMIFLLCFITARVSRLCTLTQSLINDLENVRNCFIYSTRSPTIKDVCDTRTRWFNYTDKTLWECYDRENGPEWIEIYKLTNKPK